jgi:rare lipoprotein A
VAVAGAFAVGAGAALASRDTATGDTATWQASTLDPTALDPGEREAAAQRAAAVERAARDAARTPTPTPTASGKTGEAGEAGKAGEAGEAGAGTVVATGICQASYYGEGQGTASGERFDPTALTTAHKTLPFGTRVRVTNPATAQSVVVRVNDRGPYIEGRCLDLSTAAFDRIASLSSGVATVKYEVLRG